MGDNGHRRNRNESHKWNRLRNNHHRRLQPYHALHRLRHRRTPHHKPQQPQGHCLSEAERQDIQDNVQVKGTQK